MSAAGFDDVTHSPDLQELAAFYDGRLSGAARDRVVEHLASCPVCTDILEGVHDFETEEAGSTVVRGRFGWKAWVPAAAAAAIAVAVVLSMRPTGMERLEGAWAHLDERPTGARFSGDFSYRKKTTFRGGGKERNELAAQAEAFDVAARAMQRKTAENLHAAGVAYLITGNSEYRDDAVALLEQAAAKERTAAVLTDLSAAYYAASRYQEALGAADDALKLERTPAALWNRALALEALGGDARTAWNDYLAVDRDSEWANEARTERLSQ